MTESSASIAAGLSNTLVLWDVDHTLIENGGVSKETYALAFELLTGRSPSVRPVTDGRTDFQIMRELLAANSIDATSYVDISQFEGALKAAMVHNAHLLPQRGYVLPGVIEALTTLADISTVIQSALTGNIESNAFAKVGAFGLDKWLDLEVGGFGSDNIARFKLVDAARRKVERKYGISFDRYSTILVGDTPLDVKAAHDGGARVIAVATGTYSSKELSSAGADATLDSLADLGRFLDVLVDIRNDGARA